MNKVTIYSTPTCHYCAMAKEYFTANNVAYENIDVTANNYEKVPELMDISGQQGVPVIVIGEGEKRQVIVGFDKPKVAAALGLSQ